MPHVYVGFSSGISDRSRSIHRRLLSKLISFQGRGCPYTHAFVADERGGDVRAIDVFAPDRLVVAEAAGGGFRHGPWSGHHTPGTPYDIWAIEVTEGQHAAWWQILEGWVGREYDTVGLTGFVLRSEAESDEEAAEKLFCSEAVALALKLIGVHAFNWAHIAPNQISPWLLVSSPLFAGPPVYSYWPQEVAA